MRATGPNDSTASLSRSRITGTLAAGRASHRVPTFAKLLIAAGFALIALALITVLSGLQASASSLESVDRLRLIEPDVGPIGSTSDLERAVPALPRELQHGELVGRVSLPDHGIDAPIRHGASQRVLHAAAGHVPGTAVPGSGLGNVVLAAHRDSFFRNLRHVKQGDVIVVETIVDHESKIRDEYIVRELRIIEQSDLEVLDSTDVHELSLLTCYPFDFVGPAPKRFLVRAEHVSPTQLAAGSGI